MFSCSNTAGSKCQVPSRSLQHPPPASYEESMTAARQKQHTGSQEQRTSETKEILCTQAPPTSEPRLSLSASRRRVLTTDGRRLAVD
jgi:hypothetical protein